MRYYVMKRVFFRLPPDAYYVTWGGRSGVTPSSAGVGKPLGKLSTDDFKAVIEKGLVQYGERLQTGVLLGKQWPADTKQSPSWRTFWLFRSKTYILSGHISSGAFLLQNLNLLQNLLQL